MRIQAHISPPFSNDIVTFLLHISFFYFCCSFVSCFPIIILRVIVSLHNTNFIFSGSTTSSCVTYFHCWICCPFYFGCYCCLFAYLMFEKKNQVSLSLLYLQIHNKFLCCVFCCSVLTTFIYLWATSGFQHFNSNSVVVFVPFFGVYTTTQHIFIIMYMRHAVKHQRK